MLIVLNGLKYYNTYMYCVHYIQLSTFLILYSPVATFFCLRSATRSEYNEKLIIYDTMIWKIIVKILQIDFFSITRSVTVSLWRPIFVSRCWSGLCRFFFIFSVYWIVFLSLRKLQNTIIKKKNYINNFVNFSLIKITAT